MNKEIDFLKNEFKIEEINSFNLTKNSIRFIINNEFIDFYNGEFSKIYYTDELKIDYLDELNLKYKNYNYVTK